MVVNYQSWIASGDRFREKFSPKTVTGNVWPIRRGFYGDRKSEIISFLRKLFDLFALGQFREIRQRKRTEFKLSLPNLVQEEAISPKRQKSCNEPSLQNKLLLLNQKLDPKNFSKKKLSVWYSLSVWSCGCHSISGLNAEEGLVVFSGWIKKLGSPKILKKF